MKQGKADRERARKSNLKKKERVTETFSQHGAAQCISYISSYLRNLVCMSCPPLMPDLPSPPAAASSTHLLFMNISGSVESR